MRARNLLALAATSSLVLGGGALLARDARARAGGGDDGTSVRPVGLMVNAPLSPEQANESFPDLAFFGTFEKTRVALQLRLPEGGLVDLVREASSLSAFSDDLGTDLRKKDDSFGPFESMPQIADDRSSLVLIVPSDRLPKPKASRLSLRGSIGVLVAHETATSTSPSLAIADGASFTAGPHTFEIQDTGPSDWGDGWSLTLVTKEDPAAIVRYAFRDASGQEIELSESMSMSGGGTWHQTLETEHPLQRGSFVIEAWSSPETVSIPFDVSLGLGLR